MAVLETSFLIDLLKNKERAVEVLKSIEDSEKEIFIASPSIMELWHGAIISSFPDREKNKVLGMINSISEISFDSESAMKSAEILNYLKTKGLPIELPDVMIAAIALVNGEKIITRDEHFTRIPGLMVLKY